MGKGRTPDPPRLKLLKRAKALPVSVPGPAVAAMPECPLPLDDDGRAVWDRLGPMLLADGRLTPLTSWSFALYCDAWSRYLAAAIDIRRNGMDTTSDSGSVKSSPAAGVLKEAVATLRSIGAEFGLTPASRSRLGGAAPVANLNPLDAFNAEEAM